MNFKIITLIIVLSVLLLISIAGKSSAKTACLDLSYLDSYEQAVFKSAIEEWNKYSEVQIVADNLCYNKVITCGGCLIDPKQAITSINYRGVKITKAAIVIDKVTSKDVDLKTLALHELGHFLGIMGHTKTGLMSPILPKNTSRNIDKEALEALKNRRLNW